MKTDADDLSKEQKHQVTPHSVKMRKAVSTSVVRTMLLGVMILLIAVTVVVLLAIVALNALLP